MLAPIKPICDCGCKCSDPILESKVLNLEATVKEIKITDVPYTVDSGMLKVSQEDFKKGFYILNFDGYSYNVYYDGTTVIGPAIGYVDSGTVHTVRVKAYENLDDHFFLLKDLSYYSGSYHDDDVTMDTTAVLKRITDVSE